MADLKIIVATDGKNLELARRVRDIATNRMCDSEIIDLSTYELPLYTRKTPDGDLDALNLLIQSLEGPSPWFVLLPEYNGGLPPVWINTLTWLSVQHDDFRKMFNRRRIAIGTASGGHGWKALAAMREQFAHLGSDVVGRYLRDAKGAPAKDETVEDILDRLGL